MITCKDCDGWLSPEDSGEVCGRCLVKHEAFEAGRAHAEAEIVNMLKEDAKLYIQYNEPSLWDRATHQDRAFILGCHANAIMGLEHRKDKAK